MTGRSAGFCLAGAAIRRRASSCLCSETSLPLISIKILSPLYPRKTWCLDELEWFFEKAAQDGRGQEHCTVLRIQPLEDSACPKRLQDERGKPVVFLDLVDPTTEREARPLFRHAGENTSMQPAKA